MATSPIPSRLELPPAWTTPEFTPPPWTLTENYKNNGRGYLDWPTCKDGEWIPAEAARKLLKLTPREFRDILDRGDLETDLDEERELAFTAWSNDSNTFTSFSYFNRNNMQTVGVNRLSLLRFADNNDMQLIETPDEGSDKYALLEAELVKVQEE